MLVRRNSILDTNIQKTMTTSLRMAELFPTFGIICNTDYWKLEGKEFNQATILSNAKARHIQKLRTIALLKEKSNAEKAIRKVHIYLDEQKAKDAIRAARKLAVTIEKENRLAYAKHKKTMKKILKTIVKIHNSKVKDSKKVKPAKKKNNKKKNKTKSA